MGRVVHVLQAEPSAYAMGGIERHVRSLISEQRRQGSVAALYCAGRSYALDGFDGRRVVRRRLSLEPVQFATIADERVQHGLTETLTRLDVEYVHVHSLVGFPIGLIETMRRADLQVVVTVHDYYLISPDYTLSELPATAHAGNNSVTLQTFYGLANWVPDEWLTACRTALQSANVIVAPSVAASALIEAHHPGVTPKVIPHPTLTQRSEPQPVNRRNATPPRPSRVLFLGSSHKRAKGAEQIAALVPRLVDAGIDCHFLGSRKDQVRGDWTESCTFHGPYPQADVVQRINAIDPTVGVLLSPWAETWSYTLSELWAAGVPVLSSPGGAPAERIAQTGAGIVVSDDPAEQAGAILELLNDDARLAIAQRQTTTALDGSPTVASYLAQLRAPLLPRGSSPSAPSSRVLPLFSALSSLGEPWSAGERLERTRRGLTAHLAQRLPTPIESLISRRRLRQ